MVLIAFFFNVKYILFHFLEVHVLNITSFVSVSASLWSVRSWLCATLLCLGLCFVHFLAGNFPSFVDFFKSWVNYCDIFGFKGFLQFFKRFFDWFFLIIR